MRKLFFVITTMFKCIICGQSLSVDTSSYNAFELVQQVLLGVNNNITISNVKFNNVPIAPSSLNNSNQIGMFNVSLLGKPNPMGFETGLLLCTGGLRNAIGPNNKKGATVDAIGPSYNNDPDLATIASSVVDAAVLEFDMIPSGTSLSFRYRYASEEYSENVCGNLYDAFGFFVSGPNINGVKNIALVPNTNTVVNANTVNIGLIFKDFNANIFYYADSSGCISYCGGLQNWQANKKYYQHNDFRVPPGGPPPDPNMHKLLQYNGLTVPLIAEIKNLICGQTYHFKIAIADVGDSLYDSGVFIEAGSFKSSDVSITSNTNLSDVNFNPYLLYEACTIDTLTFTRDSSFLAQQTFGISYAGSTADTSVNGDFTDAFGNPLALATSITFPAGVLKQHMILYTKQDNIAEPHEILKLKVLGQLGNNSCPFNNQPEAQFSIRDQPPVNAVALKDSLFACPNALVTLSGLVSGVLKNLDYTWTYNTNELISKDRICKIKLDTLFPNLSQLSKKEIYFTGTDFCGNKNTDTITISRLPYLPINGTSLVDNKSCAKDTVILKANLQNGVPPYYLNVFEKIGSNSILNVSNFGNEDTLSFITDTFKMALMPNTTATYAIRVFDACRLQPPLTILDTINVANGVLPLRIDTLPDSIIVCQGEQLGLVINAYGGVKPYRYFWFAKGSHDSNLIFNAQNDTLLNYGIKDRCDETQILDSVLIQVSKVQANFENSVPEPTDLINAAQSGVFYPTQFTNFSLSNDSIISYEWYLNDIKISTDKDFQMVLDYNKDNLIRLIAINGLACINIFEKRIEGQTFVYMPNIFTPNADGVNDRFASINTGVLKYDLKIYDRWGNLIFTSKDALAGWNGKINGADARDGTYFVVLTYVERETNKTQKYQGYLQVIGNK